MGPRQVIALGSATLGALAALNTALSPPRPPLHRPAGTPGTFDWSRGAVRYYEQGAGPVVLLVHGLGLTPSSFEMRFLVEVLSQKHHVYAVDLLGFGGSDRPAIPYTASLYESLLAAYIGEVTGPCTVIAAGLSGAFCIALAAALPDAVKALILSNPHLPNGYDTAPRERRMARISPVPLAGPALFRTLTSRPAVRRYLKQRVYANPELVTETMVDVYHEQARRPNAHLAPLAYLTGALRLDCTDLLPRLSQSLLLVCGTSGSRTAERTAAAYVRLQPRTQVLLLPRAGGMPHEEQPEQFSAAAISWIS